jgi:predicted permease
MRSICRAWFLIAACVQAHGAFAVDRPRAPVLGRPPTTPRALISASIPDFSGAFSPAVFATATGAVSELAVSAGLGYFAVTRRLIEPAAITSLAKIVFNLLLPAFLMTSVIRTIKTFGMSAGMLALPAVSAIQISCGLGVASLLLRALGIKPSLRSSRRFVTCAAFGNSGVLPLVLTEALFRAPYPDPTILPRASSYLAFYLLGWSPIFWSLGAAILTGADSSAPAGEARWQAVARRVASPPIVGALSGLAVGLLCPAWLLVSPRSPFKLVLTALGNMARAYPPCALLVLAGSLAGGTPSKGSVQSEPAAASASAAPSEPAARELSRAATFVGILACACTARRRNCARTRHPERREGGGTLGTLRSDQVSVRSHSARPPCRAAARRSPQVASSSAR